MSEAALEATGLTQKYQTRGDASQGELLVLEETEIKLKVGEMVALVAPSGSGKSTLLQCLGLLEAPHAGKIVVDGQDVSGLSDTDRSRLRRHTIGFVFQQHGLLSEFSALENVSVPLRLIGTSSAKAASYATDLLNGVGLGGRLHHRPAELSGGEQQRVAIARALANSPAVILADEPTGNLDPETGDIIFELLLAESRKRSCAVLAATHNISMAKRTDRILSLQERKIVGIHLDD